MFVHLHLHTEYSLIDGMVRIKPLLAALNDHEMPAVAITDQMNFFGMVKFYKAALKAGIKPIIGADIYVANDDDPTKPFSLVLLCQNNDGYRRVTELISRGYTEGQQFDKPIIDKQWLANNTEGIIALSAGRAGDIGQAILNGDIDKAQTCLSFWQQRFPDRFYLELQRTKRYKEEEYNQHVLQLALESQLPVVATNDVRFIEADDYGAHEARVCIHSGYVLDDPNRPRHYSQQQYLKTSEEMADLFKEVPSAIKNTMEIVKRCNVTMHLGESFLPDFPVPVEHNTGSYLAAFASEKLAAKLPLLFPDATECLAKQTIYQQRLQMETDVINNMGFPGYFLIVADFIQWAKENKIPVGPGRGSGAGSLVAYVLGITDLDPIAHELLFERFLNPERVSMPDFDIDFCMDNRDRVIDYVAKRYGRDSVSQIITFGTMAAKAVVRDVGRVLGNPYGFVDKLAKLIPFELGITLTKAMAQEETLRDRYDQEDDVRTLFDLALKLEGLTRNAGKHAGGVVIAPTKLTDFTPLYCEASGENLVSQFDKDDVEAVGLVKFDFLGLRTLTIIDWALQTVNRRRAKQALAAIDITTIPTDDKATFELLKRCETTAVFQLESRGMKELVKRLGPDCFDEIVALVALFRPGPLQSGMVDDFIDRKHGRAKVAYPHPDIGPILQPTYGVILYQEQVMQIAQILANYSLGAADLLRRAMGKKKPEEMAKQREIFMKGAIERDVDGDVAGGIFDLMEKFAGYGFNKSHSAAYALVAYQTAWLKTHYPSAFMAAVLSSDMDNTDKMVGFIEECRRMKLTVIPPTVNLGDYSFTVNDDNAIVYGLGALKGVGQGVIDIVVAERQAKGPFDDLFSFCQRIDSKKLNRRVLDALIRAGAMDDFGMNRASLRASVESALQAASQHEKDKNSGQVDLFAETVEPEYTVMEPWNLTERLLGEKETLGWYLSGHPLDPYRHEITAITPRTIGELRPSDSKSVLIAGMVQGVRSLITKRGDRMAIVTVTDQTGRLDIAVFSEAYQLYRDVLQKDQLLFIEGEVSQDDYTGGLRMTATRIFDLTTARESYAKYLEISLAHDKLSPGLLDQLAEILKSHAPGACAVMFNYQNKLASAKVKLPSTWRVKPTNALLSALESGLPADSVVRFHF